MFTSMKRLLLLTFIVLGCNLFSQNALSDDYGDKTNFAIGLPKATDTELKLIKEDLLQFPQIVYSEFFFNDHVLLIECEAHAKKPLDYPVIEEILFKYFGHDHIMRKYIVAFDELKAQREKTDKFTIK
jgi:hypothetical protein